MTETHGCIAYYSVSFIVRITFMRLSSVENYEKAWLLPIGAKEITISAFEVLSHRFCTS